MTDIQQRVDETAFTLMHCPLEDRVRIYRDAFEQTQAQNPGLNIEPAMVTYVAAVEKRIAEFLQQGGNA